MKTRRDEIVFYATLAVWAIGFVTVIMIMIEGKYHMTF